MGEYINYDQAVEAYNLYQNTEKAELHNYLKRPKVGNIYKFRLIFMESAELKRLKKIMTARNLRADVTLLSATFSSLLLGVYESPLMGGAFHILYGRRTIFLKIFPSLSEETRASRTD